MRLESKAVVPEIKNNTPYIMPIISTVTNGNNNYLNTERLPWKSGDFTKISGTIKTPTQLVLPVDNPEKHFISILDSALKTTGIKYSGTIKKAPVWASAKKVAHISSQPLDSIIATTLKNSNKEAAVKAIEI